jgi:AAA+ ATPase superfamily predicted ATPase
MDTTIIGREHEQAILHEVYSSEHAELLAITGRRRIGKTYLIKSFFGKKIDFEFSGILNADTTQQLQGFGISIRASFKKTKKTPNPNNWMDAFYLLTRNLDSLRKKKKMVVFIDELPWLDTHKSNFLSAFDWFWNSWAVNKNILVVICGSAASWMINKVINNKGGLHNRVTKRIHLAPFTLTETELFLKKNGITLTKYHILELYMVFGGVPHYLKAIKKGESVAQSVARICFKKDGLLVNEFDNLYKALFSQSKQHVDVIFALASKRMGLTRMEILTYTKMKDGGTFTKILDELEWSGFIASQQGFGKIKKSTLYRLTDEFSLFYIKFMFKKKNVNWQQLSITPAWKTWSGYAFENICIKHIQKIKDALGIGNVYTEVSGFNHSGKLHQPGTQIDLLIDRNDQAINICETKFYQAPFKISKSYANELRQKRDVFQQVAHPRKSLFITFITTYGLLQNSYTAELVKQEVTMEDLF